MANRRLAVYSAGHFLVDFSCALLMLGVAVPAGDPVLVLLWYNFLAFAVQMPLGLLADRVGRPERFAGAGCALCALAWLLPGMGAAAAAGLGNALYHVGGGVDTLHRPGKALWPLGLFVSPGAAGIFLGGVLAEKAGVLAVPAALALAALAAVILLLCAAELPAGFRPAPAPGSGGALACLFLVVVLRSYAGGVLSFPWSGPLGPALTACVVLGKVLGGVAADRIGVRRTVWLSLPLAAGLFLLGDLPAAGLAAVLLFNMTMPLTLGLAARLLPEGRGFAFGLCTFALFLGFLPPFLGFNAPLNGAWQGAVCALLSLPLLLMGERRAAAC